MRGRDIQVQTEPYPQIHTSTRNTYTQVTQLGEDEEEEGAYKNTQIHEHEHTKYAHTPEVVR